MNIRRRVLLGMLLSVFAVGLIGTVSYHSLAQIERKMGFVEVIDDLGNTILEIRRYEKNFMKKSATTTRMSGLSTLPRCAVSPVPMRRRL